MRKLVFTLLSSLAILVPVLSVAPARAENLSALSYADGMTKAIQHFSNFESAKALEILNHLNQRSSLSKSERPLLDLMRLTIYRQTGNNLVNVLPNEGIKYLTEAILIEDTSAHVRRGRGSAYCEIGNFEACKRDYAVAWKLTTNKSSERLASHLSERGTAYQSAGRIKEGNADLRESVRLYELLGKTTLASFNKRFILPE